MELKEQVKLITGNINDDLISLVLDKAKAEISAYLNLDYDTRYDNMAVDIAVLKVNRLGCDGLSAQGYSGASESYIDGYPQEIKMQLDKFKKKWGAL
ncbi:phage head-tail connector protein [Anaerotignum sp.]|uniref:phage head-tail connector protein n=1 Tax=Anaerotignum sp. TaxID=2039241 RepID=UPI00289A3091|nr:hypothetical protein [Anaerotignum sp.]